MWGRRLYLVATPLVLLLSIATYGLKLMSIHLIGVVVYAVFSMLLTRRGPSDYFAQKELSASPSGKAETVTFTKDTASGKKIISVILLVVSGFILITWFMMLLPMSGSFFALVFVSGLFGIIASALIVPAIFLWGRKKWAVLLGTLLSSIGGMLLLMALMFYQFTSMPEFSNQFAKVDPGIMDNVIRGSVIFGIATAVVGVLLIVLQRENDKDAKPTVEIT